MVFLAQKIGRCKNLKTEGLPHLRLAVTETESLRGHHPWQSTFRLCERSEAIHTSLITLYTAALTLAVTSTASLRAKTGHLARDDCEYVTFIRESHSI